MERDLEEIHRKLKNGILSRLDDGSGKHNILNDEDKFSDLGFDSLDMTEYVMVVEEDYKVSFDDDKLTNVKSVKEFIEYFDALYNQTYK